MTSPATRIVGSIPGAVVLFPFFRFEFFLLFLKLFYDGQSTNNIFLTPLLITTHGTRFEIAKVTGFWNYQPSHLSGFKLSSVCECLVMWQKYIVRRLAVLENRKKTLHRESNPRSLLLVTSHTDFCLSSLPLRLNFWSTYASKTVPYLICAKISPHSFYRLGPLGGKSVGECKRFLAF